MVSNSSTFPSPAWYGAADLACDSPSQAKPLLSKRLHMLVFGLLLWKFCSCFLVGVKRSASGEVAAASAKKQKTSPLVAYQQAQEHLRNQNARHVCF